MLSEASQIEYRLDAIAVAIFRSLASVSVWLHRDNMLHTWVRSLLERKVRREIRTAIKILDQVPRNERLV